VSSDRVAEHAGAPSAGAPSAAAAGGGSTRLSRDLRSLPNLISLSRIAFIYAATALVALGHPVWGLAAGTCAGISDYLDGWVARRTGQVTELGAVLDRLCDLIFETTWLLIATWLRLLSPVYFVLYLLRELVVLSARLYCGERGIALTSSFLGKLKSNFLGWTAFFVYLKIADVIPLAFAPRALDALARFGIVAGLVLSYASAYGYLRTFARAYNENRQLK
jgi:CDP-diacylglycerol---glycerol-3-phosphate 3-phosphatidyltransferase